MMGRSLAALVLVLATVTTTASPSHAGGDRWRMPTNLKRVVVTQGFHGGHRAVDFADGGRGTPVVAMNRGRVVRVRRLWSSYGWHVVIDHGARRSLYAHMRPGSLRVSRGDRVRRGERIGRIGSTGNSTGPHVHVELWREARPARGRYVRRYHNPYRFAAAH